MPSIARGLTSAGGIISGEARRPGLLQRQVDQRELEHRADAGQVVEAGAGHLGAALDVDRAEARAELDVVERLETLGREVTRLADVLEHGVVVLATGWRLRRGEVGQQRHRRGRRRRLGLDLRGLGVLDAGGELRGAGEQRGLLVAVCLRDLACPCSSARRGAARTSAIDVRRASSAARISSTSSGDGPAAALGLAGCLRVCTQHT